MLHLAHAPLPNHEPQGGAGGPRAIQRVEFATFARHRRFVDAVVAARATQRLRGMPGSPQARVLAWALLPDRWLGVIEASSAADLARQVERLQAALAPDLGDTRAEPVWATPFRARPVRDDRELAEAAREILDAPIRAGLATRRGEYAFWDAVWHAQARANPALPGEQPVAAPSLRT